jgi:general stress protein 26
MQGDRRFVAMGGLGEIIDDREKIAKAWSETMRPWFPEGPSASDLVLIHFIPDEAEYWDSSGLKGVRFLFEAAKAIVTGRRLNDDDPRRHGSVSL